MKDIIPWPINFIVKDKCRALAEPKAYFTQIDMRNLLFIVFLTFADQEFAAGREENGVASC
jgi:hypothetical protein